MWDYQCALKVKGFNYMPNSLLICAQCAKNVDKILYSRTATNVLKTYINIHECYAFALTNSIDSCCGGLIISSTSSLYNLSLGKTSSNILISDCLTPSLPLAHFCISWLFEMLDRINPK